MFFSIKFVCKYSMWEDEEMEWMKRLGVRVFIDEMLPTIPRKFRRNTDGNGSYLGIVKIPNGSPTAIIYPQIFVGVFRGISLPRYFIGIFRGNSEETQVIFRGSHFLSECPSELRCFLVVLSILLKKKYKFRLTLKLEEYLQFNTTEN